MLNRKQQQLSKLYGKDKLFRALAIDQRGALRKMLGKNVTDHQLQTFKELISNYLTPYSSAILLDPEYGWLAAKVKDKNCGLIMAYEKTGYDKTKAGRLPDLIEGISVKRLKEQGADAVKLLIYIDIDENDSINDIKKAFVERVGSECLAEEMPFFLEILTYDSIISDKKEYARLKPHKVNTAMKLFSHPRFNVDVLKVEVPVDMNFVEGFGREIVYTQAQAESFFKEQSQATNLPFIFLSAGVSAELFKNTLKFAKTAGSTFNGVLCGRSTWADATDIFKKSTSTETELWLMKVGVEKINQLNEILQETATTIEYKGN